ncbi:MAG TPA: DUF11 domain-containing protein [Thermoanaerobaculia bacterium]|nr:DUF11 domain-containing protein [Thermoanaerobaculia bacterium]
MALLFVAFFVQLGFTFAGMAPADAATVDLVVNIVSDQPAYMSFDLEHFTVTISNNGPDPATNVALAVNHPLADVPFEASATCQPVPGPNPNGPAICPAGSGTAPSPAFTRVGTLLEVTIPTIPSQSQVMVQFDNRSRCPANGSPAGGQESRCFGAPVGNYPITATVSSAETDALSPTNTATTNIFLYPPVIEYNVVITSAPATAVPGTMVDYDFEVQSTGNQPSDKLRLTATIQGQTGTMLPLTASNNPYGGNGSTLPNTILQSIDCLSASVAPFPLASVFPSMPLPWQTCPTTNLIPNQLLISPTNSPPITGFPPVNFLDNLPGTVDGPPAGGVLRFRAHVLVGDPVCVGAGDTGTRDLVLTVSANGLPQTKVGPHLGQNVASDSATTQVPGTCKVADIQFHTTPTPPSFNLNGSGVGTWTQTVTVTNISSGGTAGTATNVPVKFEHHQFAFTETQGPLTCTPASLCPPLTGGISSPSGFSFTATIPSLPPLASVTFSQQVTETQNVCWWAGTTAPINLSGHADPSPALFDPNYNPLATQPIDFTPGIFLGNNGEQAVVTVGAVMQCPGSGGGTPPGISIVKSGPFASAADANAGTPLIGQSMGAFVPDGTQIWYKVVVTNTNPAQSLLLGDVTDSYFSPAMIDTAPPSGFLHSGNTLAGWGITCTPSPANQTCHELASTPVLTGYNNQFVLKYDPALHGGNAQALLAPSATLTYLVPFTTPMHTNKCQPASLTQNTVSAAFVDALGGNEVTLPSTVTHYVGTPPCTPGTLSIQKTVLPPAVAGNPGSIPPTGLVTYEVTLTNTSTTTTLDVPHFVDTPNAPGVALSVVSIGCTVLSGGAKCPPTPVVAGTKHPAVGSPTPLPDPFDIDHEWGFVGNNTFPPQSAVKFTITVQLSNPTRGFNSLFNTATFAGENDPNGWTPASDFVSITPPRAPELSLQKKVSPQIAAPNTLVTYTVIVTNIGTVPANNSVFTDPLPAALLSSNPSGYSNVTCIDLTSSAFVPLPHGTAACPAFTSNASGLSATITTFGPNTALQFTYQALMPATPVSIDNTASVTAPTVSGALSFGVGTAQSRENVQVIAEPGGPADVPTLSQWALAMLAAVLALAGLVLIRRRLDVR